MLPVTRDRGPVVHGIRGIDSGNQPFRTFLKCCCSQAKSRGAEGSLLLAKLGRKFRTEVVGFEHWPDFDVGIFVHRIRTFYCQDNLVNSSAYS